MKYLGGQIFEEDCLAAMDRLDDASVDMILCDLPYGTTQNKWDSVIPLDELWKQYKRIIKRVIYNKPNNFIMQIILYYNK